LFGVLLLAWTAVPRPARAQNASPLDPADSRPRRDAPTSEPSLRPERTGDASGQDDPTPAAGAGRDDDATPAAGAGRDDESTPASAATTPSGNRSGSDFWSGFHFGSYGRIVAASDLQGRTGRQSRIVTFAPRIDEDDTYAEIELRREDRLMGIDTRIVATVAYAGPLFHYDGDFSERIAIRNLFAATTSTS
jgi:maltoporin